MAKMIMTGGRRIYPKPGNVDSSKIRFRDKWPNGRPFRHGAMEIEFIFRPLSRLAAEAEIEMFMETYDLVRGKDYHIPGWNYPNNSMPDFWQRSITITFNDDETFVMTKMRWDFV
jgi:hypothetical protein